MNQETSDIELERRRKAIADQLGVDPKQVSDEEARNLSPDPMPEERLNLGR